MEIPGKNSAEINIGRMPRALFTRGGDFYIYFFFNGVRAFLLAYIAAKEGIAATIRFHDPAGGA